MHHPSVVTMLVAVGLIIGAASRASAEDALPTQAMRGPYHHAFPKRHTNVGTAGKLRYEVHWVAHGPSLRAYSLAIRIGRRWFVAPSPLEIELESGAAGSYYDATIDAIAVRRARLPDGSAGVTLVLRETIRRYCNECVGHARGRLTQTTHRTTTLTCGTGASGGPICLYPEEVGR